MTDTPPVASPQYKAAQLIDGYLKLRAKKKALEAEHKKVLGPINALMEQLDGLMLGICDTVGTTTLKEEGIGTAFVGESTSASIKEPDAFKQFVIANERWDLVNWSANAEACVAYAAEAKVLPPGVTVSTARYMNVRSPTKKK